MSANPLVSVFMVSYNHGKFVAQAIESVLMQRVDFELEIVIGDDCSTDGTREIVEQFAAKYPFKIRAILHSQNLGFGGRVNSRTTLETCTGKYIAPLEGDDFWADCLKLKKQIDFLEENPKYVGCFHNTEERYEEDDTQSSFLYCNFPAARKITFTDLTYTNLIPTCSVVYKNRLFLDFPKWYMDLKMGDWPLHLLNAQYGDFWYIPQVMAVHRLHTKSTWMLQDAEKNRQYTVDAYDTMISGFSSDKKLSDQLVVAKEEFLRSYELAQQKSSFKQKAKGLITRIIHKI
jgi:glycosyltransferase involved in cell wall biosynthesis